MHHGSHLVFMWLDATCSIASSTLKESYIGNHLLLACYIIIFLTFFPTDGPSCFPSCTSKTLPTKILQFFPLNPSIFSKPSPPLLSKLPNRPLKKTVIGFKKNIILWSSLVHQHMVPKSKPELIKIKHTRKFLFFL